MCTLNVQAYELRSRWPWVTDHPAISGSPWHDSLGTLLLITFLLRVKVAASAPSIRSMQEVHPARAQGFFLLLHPLLPSSFSFFLSPTSSLSSFLFLFFLLLKEATQKFLPYVSRATRMICSSLSQSPAKRKGVIVTGSDRAVLVSTQYSAAGVKPAFPILHLVQW